MMKKKPYFDTCPQCGANLDPGERCECLDEPVLNGDQIFIGIDLASKGQVCSQEALGIQSPSKMAADVGKEQVDILRKAMGIVSPSEHFFGE